MFTPFAFGGTGLPWIGAGLAGTIGAAKFWQLDAVRKVGNDVVLEYEASAASGGNGKL